MDSDIKRVAMVHNDNAPRVMEQCLSVVVFNSKAPRVPDRALALHLPLAQARHMPCIAFSFLSP